MVSTHPKNMFVKLDHFPKHSGWKFKKNLWVATTVGCFGNTHIYIYIYNAKTISQTTLGGCFPVIFLGFRSKQHLVSRQRVQLAHQPRSFAPPQGCPSQGRHTTNHMDVSENRVTPKWMVYNGKPYLNRWFGGTTILGNTHMCFNLKMTTLWHFLRPNFFHPTWLKKTFSHLDVFTFNELSSVLWNQFNLYSYLYFCLVSVSVWFLYLPLCSTHFPWSHPACPPAKVSKSLRGLSSWKN